MSTILDQCFSNCILETGKHLKAAKFEKPGYNVSCGIRCNLKQGEQLWNYENNYEIINYSKCKVYVNQNFAAFSLY